MIENLLQKDSVILKQKENFRNLLLFLTYVRYHVSHKENSVTATTTDMRQCACMSAHRCFILRNIFNLGLAITSFIQITFLYLQLFVPFVAAFWLMFGDSNGQGKIDRVLVNSSNTTSFNIGSTFINIDTFQTLNDLDTIVSDQNMNIVFCLIGNNSLNRHIYQNIKIL